MFTTVGHDANGVAAIELLRSLGYQTKILAAEEQAAPNNIALFTPLEISNLQGARGRYLRTSSVKLTDDVTPKWAQGTRLRVAVLRTSKAKFLPKGSYRLWGFAGAVSDMAEQYKKWLNEGSTLLLPWTTGRKAVLPGTVCETKIKDWLSQPDVCDFRTRFVIKRSAQETMRTIKVGQWEVNYCDKRVVFPASAAEAAVSMLASWQKYFIPEQTWVRDEVGVPSLFVRFDCVVRDNKLVVYEIEERPAGMGISAFVNDEFGILFDRAAESWPQFRVEISPLRRATDDYLWVNRLGWQHSQSKLVLVRAEPEEASFYHLEPCSVSSLKAKGNKFYGLKMGLWTKVSSADELPWDEAFVLKPLCGSKVRDLEFWDPKRRPGSSVRSKVIAELAKQGEMFLQMLHSPMETGIDKFPWMIFRIFFAYNPQTKKWVPLGGNWNARHNLRIHGASDAIFGPAVVE